MRLTRVYEELEDQGGRWWRTGDERSGNSWRVWGGNPILEPMPVPEDWGVRGLVVWSGSVASGLFERSPLNWTKSAHEQLNGWCEQARAMAEQIGRRVLVMPHARHILSDAPSASRFIEDLPDDAIGLAFSPGLLLEAGMIDDATDHLTRMFELLAHRSDVWVLHDVAPPQHEDEPLRCVPMGQGALPLKHLTGLIRQFKHLNRPIVCPGESVAQVLSQLGLRNLPEGVESA